jgi:hypothetical protein
MQEQKGSFAPVAGAGARRPNTVQVVVQAEEETVMMPPK